MEHSGWHILLFPRSLFAGFACTRQGAQPLEAVAARRGILPVHKYGVVTAQGFWPRRTRATLAREDGPFAVLDEVTQPSLIASKSFQRLREIRPPTHGGLLEVRLCCGACGSRQPRKIVQYMVSPSCVLMWGRVCCASCYFFAQAYYPCWCERYFQGHVSILGSQQRTSLRRLHAGVFYGLTTGTACASHSRGGKAGCECVECLRDAHCKFNNISGTRPEFVQKELCSDFAPSSADNHDFFQKEPFSRWPRTDCSGL